VTFLPSRLNRQPVIVRGLTADELWVTTGLSAVVGLSLGVPLAILLRSLATAPALIVVGVAVGLFVGGGVIRRLKRGRPEAWVYRALEWQLCVRFPGLCARVGLGPLITRSGRWTTRRALAPARR
jgi:conjugative transfer region protein (TIGR03750 family)